MTMDSWTAAHLDAWIESQFGDACRVPVFNAMVREYEADSELWDSRFLQSATYYTLFDAVNGRELVEQANAEAVRQYQVDEMA